MAREPSLPDLYEGFEAYRTPTDQDYQRVLNAGLVVPDTNVLLNLYRYNPAARADLLAVLARVDDQLWVPHQVLIEFWRNRESAISDPQDSAEKTALALANQFDGASNALLTWKNRVAAPHEQVAELLQLLEIAFDNVARAINASVDPEELRRRRDTNNDVVLKELEPILEGRVGRPLVAQELETVVNEGLRRAGAGEPPGYEDRDKQGAEAAGDYLLWEQVLREAERRRCDVLLVTGDVKEDWWRRERGEHRGPRLELVSELRDRAGVNLYMVRPETLLRYARLFLQVDVREESVQDVERVASLFEAEARDGWTANALLVALKRLDVEAPVQAEVIRAALENGGFVPRDVVYDLGGYEEGRTLRGFTRPANRITQELRDRGLISQSAPDILEAVYDPQFSYVQASGFRVPTELLSVGAKADELDESRARLSVTPTTTMTSGADTATLTFSEEDGSQRTIVVPFSDAKGAMQRLLGSKEKPD